MNPGRDQAFAIIDADGTREPEAGKIFDCPPQPASDASVLWLGRGSK